MVEAICVSVQQSMWLCVRLHDSWLNLYVRHVSVQHAVVHPRDPLMMGGLTNAGLATCCWLFGTASKLLWLVGVVKHCRELVVVKWCDSNSKVQSPRRCSVHAANHHDSAGLASVLIGVGEPDGLESSSFLPGLMMRLTAWCSACSSAVEPWVESLVHICSTQQIGCPYCVDC